MKVIAYVPIKLNSERIVAKSIKPFDDGTPLCSFMFNTLKNAKGIDECYCFCSDEAIEAYLPEGISYLKRSSVLDTPQTKCHEIIQSFVEQKDADIYVLAHATSPFLKSSSVEACIEKVKSGAYDSAFTAAVVQDFLWQNGQPMNFDSKSPVRTQELSPVYKETVGVYVFTKASFAENGQRIGKNPYLHVVDTIESMDIDYPDDFDIANAVYMYLLRQNGRKGQ